MAMLDKVAMEAVDSFAAASTFLVCTECCFATFTSQNLIRTRRIRFRLKQAREISLGSFGQIAKPASLKLRDDFKHPQKEHSIFTYRPNSSASFWLISGRFLE